MQAPHDVIAASPLSRAQCTTRPVLLGKALPVEAAGGIEIAQHMRHGHHGQPKPSLQGLCSGMQHCISASTPARSCGPVQTLVPHKQWRNDQSSMRYSAQHAHTRATTCTRAHGRAASSISGNGSTRAHAQHTPAAASRQQPCRRARRLLWVTAHGRRAATRVQAAGA